jgi:uncharacterized protein (TIGR03086 family)
MTPQLDLEPAGLRVLHLVDAVPDDGLGRPTPCAKYNVGDLLDHIDGAALAFAAAAVKQPLEPGPSPDAANLGPDWRADIREHVVAMTAAWREPEAWLGMTAAGGVDLPGDVAAVVGLDELVIHGWDLAKALGMPAGYDGPGLEAVFAMVQHFSSAGIDGLFGPTVAIPDDAPLLDRILGVAGRDPAWEPPA